MKGEAVEALPKAEFANDDGTGAAGFAAKEDDDAELFKAKGEADGFAVFKAKGEPAEAFPKALAVKA